MKKILGSSRGQIAVQCGEDLKTMNRLFNYSKGQMMILYAGAIVALLGAVALCTDVAVMYVNWQQAQKAADAAALAGATYLPSNPSTAISTAQNWPENN